MWDLILRLVVASCFGALIGLDREYRAKEAGLRTHFLVCLGSALFMIVSQHGFSDVLGTAGVGLDPSRIAAHVVSGIGFLGAGSIVISGKSKIKGLTTAAGLWASACIGLVIGIGFFECGIVATLAVYVIIRNFKKLEDRITFNDGWFSVYVRLEDVSNLSDFYTGIKDMGMKVGEVQVYDKKHEFKGAIVSIQNCAHRDREDVLSLLNSLRGVIDVKYIS